MPSFNDARALILQAVKPIGAERVEALQSLGRVLAEDIVAARDLPAYDNSAMDGFAVRVADCTSDARLPIAGYVPAGAGDGGTLAPGTAVRIMTGAPLPAGCDAVVPFEDAEETDDTMCPLGPMKARQHMRFAGEDVQCGSVVLSAGTLVRPSEISMLASLGCANVEVYRRPRAAILSTGDELVELGHPLAPGKIYNSNSLALAAAVRETGAVAEIIGIAQDTVESHREKLRRGLEADVLITSAGVSTGDRDLVREVLAELGAEQVFWRVDVKPGGPTAFALYNGKPVFCLPGNPVAALLMFDAFVRPALLAIMGHTRVLRRGVTAVLQQNEKKKPGKIKLLRVRLTREQGRILAHSAGDQNTGRLKTIVNCDGYAVLAADRTDYASGDEVEVYLLSDALNMLSREGACAMTETSPSVADVRARGND